MNLDDRLQCPRCSGKDFTAKYESTYIYSYELGFPENDVDRSKTYTLPFLFDKRDQKNTRQYVECNNCGAQYPCEFTLDSKELDFTIVKKAIHSHHTKQPEFLG